MATLEQVASKARDLYNQDYADRTEFFTLKDFKFHVAARYSAVLNALYQAARKENKIESGFSAVEINPQWLITETVEELTEDPLSHHWYAETKFNIFSFDFDTFANGLNQIRSFGACKPKKISTQELPFYDIIPTTPDCYYYLEGKKRPTFLKKPSLPLTLYYIPEVNANDENCVMSDSIVPDLIESTLRLMFGAKTGNVVKEANDGNTNDALQQQVNPTLNKIQQQG
jgi:hypothetical protein